MKDDTKEDFESAIRSKGLDPSDFEVKEETKHEEGTIHAVTGSIKVIRKSNGIEKIYKSGHGTAWPIEFIDDLNSGFFN